MLSTSLFIVCVLCVWKDDIWFVVKVRNLLIDDCSCDRYCGMHPQSLQSISACKSFATTVCSVKDLLDSVDDNDIVGSIREIMYSVRDIVTLTVRIWAIYDSGDHPDLCVYNDWVQGAPLPAAIQHSCCCSCAGNCCRSVFVETFA